MAITLTFPVRNYHKADEFNMNGKKKRTYFATVNVKDVPEGIPMGVNPREEHKLTTKVAKKIKENLLDVEKNNFHMCNKGIVVTAHNAKFDLKTRMVTVTLLDEEIHGSIDGGHTYKVILENKEMIQGEKFVHFEIMTGIEDKEEVKDIAEARKLVSTSK